MGDSVGEVNITASLRVGRLLGDTIGAWSVTPDTGSVGDGKEPGIFVGSVLDSVFALSTPLGGGRTSAFRFVGDVSGVENLLLASLCPDAWPKLPGGLWNGGRLRSGRTSCERSGVIFLSALGSGGLTADVAVLGLEELDVPSSLLLNSELSLGRPANLRSASSF